MRRDCADSLAEAPRPKQASQLVFRFAQNCYRTRGAGTSTLTRVRTDERVKAGLVRECNVLDLDGIIDEFQGHRGGLLCKG